MARSYLSVARDLALLVAAGALLVQPIRAATSKYEAWVETRRLDRRTVLRWNDILRAGTMVEGSDSLVPPGPVLVEFGDYECPYCRAAYPKVQRLEEELPTLRLVYIQLPLTSIHPHALDAADAALCAGQQGLFRQMHSYLFSSTGWLEGISWDSVAVLVGIPNVPRFQVCLSSVNTANEIKRSRELAQSLGVQATPTFLRRGKYYGPTLPSPATLIRH